MDTAVDILPATSPDESRFYPYRQPSTAPKEEFEVCASCEGWVAGEKTGCREAHVLGRLEGYESRAPGSWFMA